MAERALTSTFRSIFQQSSQLQLETHSLFSNDEFDEEQELENQIQGLPREQLKLVKRMKMGRSSQQCTICFTNFQRREVIRQLPCEHIFHEKCIFPWFRHQHKCPLCRLNLYEYYKD